MKIAGNYNFTNTREEVWAALHDRDILFHTMPGCQRFERIGEHTFDYTLTISLIAVQGTYTGQLGFVDISAPQQCRFMLGSASTDSSIQGEGMIVLREEGDLTIMDYGCEFRFGGVVATVERELLDAAAKVLINQGLRTLAQHIGMRAVAQADNGTPVHTNSGIPEPARMPPPSSTAIPVHSDADTPDTRSRHSRFLVPKYDHLTHLLNYWERVGHFFQDKPWLFWLPVAFLAGYRLGRNQQSRVNPGSRPDGPAAER